MQHVGIRSFWSETVEVSVIGGVSCVFDKWKGNKHIHVMLWLWCVHRSSHFGRSSTGRKEDWVMSFYKGYKSQDGVENWPSMEVNFAKMLLAGEVECMAMDGRTLEIATILRS